MGATPGHQRSTTAAESNRHLGVGVIAGAGVVVDATNSLADYVCEGPLLSICGLDAEEVQADIATWERLGRRLAEQLGFDHAHLDDIQRLRIYHYYLPVFFWVQQQLQRHKANGGPHTALVLGISAPQGCGKSTLVEQLEQLCNWLGTQAAAVSVDDFYLTHKDQQEVAAANPGNGLLQYRGNAGTHDLELGTQTLQTLRQLASPEQSAAVPRYDKSAYQGRGDRAAQDAWPRVSGPLQVIFFEGWMSGFAPVEASAAAQVDPALAAVNQQLTAYQAAWDELVDSWLVIRIKSPQVVFKWRLQAEERMRAAGKAGMTDEQIADFVSRFMPAYEAYLPGLYARGPTTAQAGRTLIIEVDQNRSPVLQQPAPVV